MFDVFIEIAKNVFQTRIRRQKINVIEYFYLNDHSFFAAKTKFLQPRLTFARRRRLRLLGPLVPVVSRFPIIVTVLYLLVILFKYKVA